MKNRSVSLTGATGFVGWHLAEAFRDAGWHVRAIVRPEGRRALPPLVERIEAPLTAAALTTVLAGSELVVHCAGLVRASDQAAFDTVNVEGTRAVVEAVNQTGARLVLISSAAAGGPGTPDRPRRESDSPAPVNAYGVSKLRGEDVVRAFARPPWTILRPAAVYGERDRGFLPLFKLARRGWFVRPTAAAMSFTLIDIAELARAVVPAGVSDRAIGETLALGHREPQTTDVILQTLAGAFNRRYSPRRLPMTLARAAAAVGDVTLRYGYPFLFDSGRLAEFEAEGFVCAVDRARDVLGFTATTSLSDGFLRTARWYEHQGWL